MKQETSYEVRRVCAVNGVVKEITSKDIEVARDDAYEMLYDAAKGQAMLDTKPAWSGLRAIYRTDITKQGALMVQIGYNVITIEQIFGEAA